MSEIFYSKFKSKAYVWVFLASFISFFAFHIANIYFFENTFTTYALYFCRYFIDSLIPVFSASVLFSGTKVEGYKMRMLSALKLSLPRLVYLIPYNYLYYMSEGFDSVESLMFLLIRSAFLLIIFSCEIYLYCAVAILFAKRKESNWNFYTPSAMFDFASGVTVGIFAINFFKFIFNIISEIIDAVLYFVDYGEFYQMSDIIFMLGKFLFALAMLLLSQVIICSIRVRHLKKCVVKSEEDEQL